MKYMAPCGSLPHRYMPIGVLLQSPQGKERELVARSSTTCIGRGGAAKK